MMKNKAGQNQNVAKDKLSFFQKYKWAFIPMIVAIALYFNTLNHGFVLDDKIVFQDKAIVSGLQGIPKIVTEKYLPEVQNIKPYRPITGFSFAIDYQFFKNDNEAKMASNLHLTNVLYYSLASFFTFILLFKLFKNKIIATAISLLFAAHPIHTEVVANIKSRDEILAYLFGILMLIFFIKFKESKLKKWLFLSLTFYLLALFSKENAILFIAILPFINYFTSPEKGFKALELVNLKLFIIPAVLYLLMQRIILGINLMPQMTELDNMLVGIPNAYENLATRIYIVGFYLYKMVFPHPLFYDYSINYITKKSFASIEVWMSLFTIISLVVLIIKGIVKKSKFAFGVLFMFVTFTLTCNLFLSIGTTFAERLAFTPSLGFLIALVYLLNEVINRFKMKQVYLLLLIFPILSLYSFKTVSRNAIWKDNDTLFTHDFLQSSKSLRVQNNYGAIFYQRAKASTDTVVKKELFLKSIQILDKVTSDYANYVEAYIQKGIAYLEIKNCGKALENFETARRIATYNPVVEANLGIGYINCGKPQEAVEIFRDLLNNDKLLESFYLKHIGVAHYNLKNIDSAEYYFTRWKNDFPDNAEVDGFVKLVADYKKGIIPNQKSNESQVIDNKQIGLFDEGFKMYQSGNKMSAEKKLLEFIKINPNHAMSYAVLGLISDEKHQFLKAINYYKKSILLNPADFRIQYNLGNTYLKNNDEVNAINQFEKVIISNPAYINPYKSLELYYKSKNNIEKFSYYSNKIKELEKK